MNGRAFKLPDHLEAQLNDLAGKTGRSHGEIVASAVETYLLGRVRWNTEMDKALADARDGNGHDGEEVLAWMESWGSESERPEPPPVSRKP